jgi:hypothetical protein
MTIRSTLKLRGQEKDSKKKAEVQPKLEEVVEETEDQKAMDKKK